MDNRKLDDVARRVATGGTRRALVQALGAGTLGGAVFTALRPAAVGAQDDNTRSDRCNTRRERRCYRRCRRNGRPISRCRERCCDG